MGEFGGGFLIRLARVLAALLLGLCLFTMSCPQSSVRCWQTLFRVRKKFGWFPAAITMAWWVPCLQAIGTKFCVLHCRILAARNRLSMNCLSL